MFKRSVLVELYYTTVCYFSSKMWTGDLMTDMLFKAKLPLEITECLVSDKLSWREK